MNCLTTLELRLVRGPDGIIYTDTGYHDEYWQDYCEIFDGVFIVARVVDRASITSNFRKVESPSVHVIVLPDIRNPAHILRRLLGVRRKIRPLLGKQGIMILKVPGLVSTLVWLSSFGRGRYGVQVVGDPFDVFSKGATKFRLRAVYKYFFYYMQILQCRFAVAAAYVTQHALQKRYPSKGRMMSFSDIFLTDEDFIEDERLDAKIMDSTSRISNKRDITICNIGTMEQPYKGQDIIVEACKLLKEQGIEERVFLVGEGKYRANLEDQISKDNLQSSFVLTGFISNKEELQSILDSSDLYCHPARTEGLPRAVIEAMARGLPIISTDMGGLVELVDKESIIKEPLAEQLAERIKMYVEKPTLLKEVALKNWEKAREYKYEEMKKRKMEFLLYMEESANHG